MLGADRARRTEPPLRGKTKNKYSAPLMGQAFIPPVIDDHSRVAYAEIYDDETALTATAVFVRAVEWF